MQLHLASQVAVVVGGGRGIGRAIADFFAAEECRVAIVDRELSAAPAGPRTTCLQADATDYAAVQAAAKQIEQALGKVQHVVYAAGCGSGKFGFPFWNLQPADWDKVLRVNLVGAVNAAHAFAPTLVEQQRGTLLFISSVAGQIGSQTDPPYSAAKAGLINFAQCAAKDLAPYSVRVNTICPGMVKTDLNRGIWQAWHDQQPAELRRSYDEWALEKIRKVCPLGRWQTPEEIAALAVFLASDRACNITGQTMNVDGGFVMHW
ncbi:MAG TPA: SDR family oxidoreductase [Pirellulaceae bacterium]|nr:SDR family oxidoreductase [Pirellulaceae bacterium]